MPDPGDCEGEKKVKTISHPGTLPGPAPVGDRLYVRSRAPIAPRTIGAAVALLAASAFVLFGRDGWVRTKPAVPQLNVASASAPPHQPLKRLRRPSLRTPQAKDFKSESSQASADDLGLGFSTARWGMTMNDAKALWPLEQPYSQPVSDPAGPHPSPIHDEDFLLLDHYAFGGCNFSVKFRFRDNKLFEVQIEADGGDLFQTCHSAALASLTRQYGEAPQFPYRGYSLHCSWSGPLTTVVYNEIRGAVVEIAFSKSG